MAIGNENTPAAIRNHPNCGRGYVLSHFFFIQPKRIQAELGAEPEAGSEGVDPIIAGLLGPEVAKVQEKLFLFAL